MVKRAYLVPAHRCEGPCEGWPRVHREPPRPRRDPFRAPRCVMAAAGSRAARRALAGSSPQANGSAPPSTTWLQPPSSAPPPFSSPPWTVSALWYVGMHLAIGAFLCLLLSFFYLWGRRLRRIEAEAAAAREREGGAGAQGAAVEGFATAGPVQGQQNSASHIPDLGRGLDPALLPLLPQKVFEAEASVGGPPLAEMTGAKDGASALGSSGFAGAASGMSGAAPDVALLRECPVCLSEYEQGDVIKWVPGCGHAFHGPCIESWLGSRTTCPLCRMQVAPSLEALSKGSETGHGGEQQGVGRPGGSET